MKKSTLIIPIAAFALSASSAAAFNENILEQAGLSNSQIEAFSEARELRQAGDREAARDLLVEAGIDIDTLHEIKEALHDDRAETRAEIKAAIAGDDYNAFLTAIVGTKLEDKITSENDFELFVEAHQLRESGDREAAAEILAELGIEKPEHHRKGGRGFGKRDITNAPFWNDLTDTQQEDIQSAIEAGDRGSVREILEAAGIERPDRDEKRGQRTGFFRTTDA